MNNDLKINTSSKKNAIVTILSVLVLIAIFSRGILLFFSDNLLNVTVLFCCFCALLTIISLIQKLALPLAVVTAALLLSFFLPTVGYILIDLALFIAILVLALASPESENENKKSENEPVTTRSDEAIDDQSNYYILLGSHILLSIFTLGIWHLIWIYKTTRFCNLSKTDGHRSPVISLLLSICVPLYYIYWTYKSAQRVDTIACEKGINGKISGVCLALAIFVPVLTPIIIQDKINRTVEQASPRESYFVSIVLHTILTFFTLGIWNLIWVYRTTRFTNFTKNKIARNPILSLLLWLFIPFYSIYWTYESAQRSDLILQERGILSASATLCLIFAIFIPFIPPLIIQSKINQAITESYKKLSVYEETEALEKYKKLFDGGIITEEEYESKKKQLLGL